MARYVTLDAEALAEALSALPDWQRSADGKAISRSFVLTGFAEAFGFMTECALVAQKLDHHPDWSNSFRRVDVTLTTHATGGLTDHDIALAKAMDLAFRRRN